MCGGHLSHCTVRYLQLCNSGPIFLPGILLDLCCEIPLMEVINIHTYTIEISRYTDCMKLQSRNHCFFKLRYKAFCRNFQDSKNHQKTITKNLTIIEITLSGIPARTHSSLPGKTDSIREKKKENEKWGSQGKREGAKVKEKDITEMGPRGRKEHAFKKLRTSNKISPCFLVYMPAKLFWKFTPIIKYNKNLDISHKDIYKKKGRYMRSLM